jgi:nucleoside-diphosphate-sugar epimerase
MNIFLTGASGYIGGNIAARLVAQGHEVRGLVRDRAKAELLRGRGIAPVLGNLEDEQILANEARRADGVINTANADDRRCVEALIGALEGSGKPLIHTSGSSVIGDDARGGSVNEAVFDEDTPFVVAPAKLARHALNQSVQSAASRGVRSIVVCPTLIYGVGQGLNRHSIQIPFLVSEARAQGVARVVGEGVNRWSTVHIDDLTDLYLLALHHAPGGAFYFAENGEVSFAAIGSAIAERLGLSGVESIPAEDAARLWGTTRAFYTFGSNSRVIARRARRELGWNPRHDSALTWIREEMPIENEEHP